MPAPARSIAATLALLAVGAAAGPAAARMSIVYDETAGARAIARPDAGRGLTPARGGFRQDPGAGGMFLDGDDAPYRIGKVSGAELEALTPAGMAARLRQEITEGAYGAASHLVAVDELGRTAGEPAPRPARRGMALPPPAPGGLGSRFARAMELLDVPSPFGGTWAERVHVYLAPAVHSAMAAGRGPLRNLGRDGKPHFPTYRALMSGLARAGGVWLEMYHVQGGARTPFTAREWRAAPSAVTALLTAAGGRADRLHFVFTRHDLAPEGAPAGCDASQACAWSLAESTAAGRAILGNGPGAYRVGGQADGWLREFNARF